MIGSSCFLLFFYVTFLCKRYASPDHLIIFGSDTITFAVQIIKYPATHQFNAAQKATKNFRSTRRLLKLRSEAIQNVCEQAVSKTTP